MPDLTAQRAYTCSCFCWGRTRGKLFARTTQSWRNSSARHLMWTYLDGADTHPPPVLEHASQVRSRGKTRRRPEPPCWQRPRRRPLKAGARPGRLGRRKVGVLRAKRPPTWESKPRRGVIARLCGTVSADSFRTIAASSNLVQSVGGARQAVNGQDRAVQV